MRINPKLIDILEKYSTEEQHIGYWIDGKKIFRKVFTGLGGFTTDTQIGTITNLSQIISYKGAILSNYGQWWAVPEAFTDAGYNTFVYCDTAGKVYLKTGNFFSNKRYNIIVEYTKTTD